MKDTLAELASVVRYHRRQSGLTQQELASLAGVGKTAVFDVENGKTSLRLTTMVKILTALNIRVELTSPLMAEWEKTSHAQG